MQVALLEIHSTYLTNLCFGCDLSIGNWVLCSGMLLYLHHRNSKLFFHPTKYLNLSYTVLNLLYSGCDHVHCILKTVKYVWLCSNMPIYKIKSHFGPCSKICDNIYNILSVIKKRFASRWVRHQSSYVVDSRLIYRIIVTYWKASFLIILLMHCTDWNFQSVQCIFWYNIIF